MRGMKIIEILYFFEFFGSIFGISSVPVVLIITWGIALKHHDKYSTFKSGFIALGVFAAANLLMAFTDLNWLKYVISVLFAAVGNYLMIRIQRKIFSNG